VSTTYRVHVSYKNADDHPTSETDHEFYDLDRAREFFEEHKRVSSVWYLRLTEIRSASHHGIRLDSWVR
jgi:hypothetical protein